MVKLVAYSPGYEEQTLSRIAQFFGFHQVLSGIAPAADEMPAADSDLRDTLAEWLKPPSAFYIITENEQPVGFLRICYRGPDIAWIEDVFVDTGYRGRGIATGAIQAAEQIVANTPGYSAISLDVVPRNLDALKLYHRLGYTDIALVTLRKEFDSSHRDCPVCLFGLDFDC